MRHQPARDKGRTRLRFWRIRFWSWSEAEAWRRGVALVALACCVLYGFGLAFEGPGAASPWGLAYGVAAALLLVGAALYGLRRRAMRLASRLGLGRARSWLYFHLYGGALFLLLMLMHSGFRLPNGNLTRWLWAVSLWTVLSGWVGLILQRWIPRVLASGLSTEVHFDRIPSLVEEIRQQAEELVATCDDAVGSLYARQVAPALMAPRRRWVYFFDITGGIHARLKDFEYLAGLLPAAEREKLQSLERLYRGKLEIDAHYTLQQALRWWLFGHVPPSLLALLLMLLHVFAVLYY